MLKHIEVFEDIIRAKLSLLCYSVESFYVQYNFMKKNE